MRTLIGLLLALSLACPVLAAPLDVVINEVAWMGSVSASADEWIELYNNTSSAIDLTGWKLVKVLATPVEIDLAGSIPANGYYLVEHAETSVNDVAGDLISTSLTLGNSGNTFELRDASATVVDVVTCSGIGWYAGENTNKHTMERKNPTLGGDAASNWADNDGVTINGLDSGNVAINGTPKAQNSVYSVTVPGPSIVHIHCLDETAIDVYFDAPLDLATAQNPANYTLTAAGVPHPPASAIVSPADTAMVHLTGISGIAAQALVDATATGIQDQQGNPGTSAAQYYAGVAPMIWVRTDANTDFVPDIVAQTPDAFVTVQGMVTAPNTFTFGEVAMQDLTAGLVLYSQGDTDTMEIGDEIRASGVPVQFNGKLEITEIRYDLLTQGNAVAPQIVTLAEFLANAELYEGMLVGVLAVSATGGDPWPAIDTNANVNVTDDGGTSTTILRVDRDTDIDGTPEPTWPVSIVGVTGQYTTATPANDGYQIQPRSLLDLDALCSQEGATRSCYSGPAGTEVNPPCQAGTQTCTGGSWGICDGEHTPGPGDSICDGIDDDCDGQTDEHANTDTDPLNCGACGHVCDLVNVDVNECVVGTCVIGTCDTGFDSCDAIEDNGCEVTLGTDTHCAACGDDCTTQFPHAGGSCTAGACTMGTCEQGWDDCSADPGCETNTVGDKNHCGDCTTVCPGTEVCINSACSSTCVDLDNDGFADSACGGNDCDDTDELVYPAAPELCDGADNDCDTETDETFTDLGDLCDGDDDDLCQNGTRVCAATQDATECQETQHFTEACNGVDDDCDTSIDEDWTDLGEACDGSDTDACAEGAYVCNTAGNGIVCDESPTGGHEEVCNGEDDDCDGTIDDGFDGTYTCGVGACENEVPVCQDGEPQQCVPKAAPEAEEVTCDDGVDNDCDGFSDALDPNCSDGGGGSCGCGAAGSPGSLALLALALFMLAVLRRTE